MDYAAIVSGWDSAAQPAPSPDAVNPAVEPGRGLLEEVWRRQEREDKVQREMEAAENAKKLADHREARQAKQEALTAEKAAKEAAKVRKAEERADARREAKALQLQEQREAVTREFNRTSRLEGEAQAELDRLWQIRNPCPGIGVVPRELTEAENARYGELAAQIGHYNNLMDSIEAGVNLEGDA